MTFLIASKLLQQVREVPMNVGAIGLWFHLDREDAVNQRELQRLVAAHRLVSSIFAASCRSPTHHEAHRLALDGLRHLLLPALNLSLFKFAMMVRLARPGTREVMLTETVKFARAAGLSERTILLRHVLKLISSPIAALSKRDPDAHPPDQRPQIRVDPRPSSLRARRSLTIASTSRNAG
jgi:Binding-protein-dependent transport system inner membrane component